MTNPNESSIHSKLVILFFSKSFKSRAHAYTFKIEKKNQNILYFFREDHNCLLDLRKLNYKKYREKILKNFILARIEDFLANEENFEFFLPEKNI